MKYLKRKDNSKRNSYKKNESKLNKLKSISKNLDINKRLFIQLDNINYLRKNSKVRIKNRCILTARGKGIHKDFKLSRIKLRDYASNGLLSGVKKSSW